MKYTLYVTPAGPDHLRDRRRFILYTSHPQVQTIYEIDDAPTALRFPRGSALGLEKLNELLGYGLAAMPAKAEALEVGGGFRDVTIYTLYASYFISRWAIYNLHSMRYTLSRGGRAADRQGGASLPSYSMLCTLCSALHA